MDTHRTFETGPGRCSAPGNRSNRAHCRSGRGVARRPELRPSSLRWRGIRATAAGRYSGSMAMAVPVSGYALDNHARGSCKGEPVRPIAERVCFPRRAVIEEESRTGEPARQIPRRRRSLGRGGHAVAFVRGFLGGGPSRGASSAARRPVRIAAPTTRSTCSCGSSSGHL